jgi:hypothetical protein
LACAKIFRETVAQLTLEVRQLTTMSAYYDAMNTLANKLGSTLLQSLERTMEVLLLASDKYSTTTTTAAPNNHVLVKYLSLALDVGSMVGDAMGLYGVKQAYGATVKSVGTVWSKTMTLSNAALDIGKASYAVANSEDSSDSAGGGGDEFEGEEDDENLDAETVDLSLFVQKITLKWERVFAQQRRLMAANWQRLNQAMSIYQSCAAGSIAIDLAVGSAGPAIDWFAMSVVVPNKYVIYAQRNYASYMSTEGDGTVSTTGCEISDATCYNPCSVVPCYSGTKAASAMGGTKGYNTKPGLQLWLGQVEEPNNGPPQDFWNYLLRAEGPVVNYAQTAYPSFWSSEASGASGSTTGNVTQEAADLSAAMMAQCQFIPKTYVTTSLLDSGGFGAPSDQIMECKVFGAPWMVRWLPDCNGCSELNPFFCDSTWSNKCQNQPVANFNSVVPIMPDTYSYQTGPLQPSSSGSNLERNPNGGLIGCCMPNKDIGQYCDFPVCDCATLAAAIHSNMSDYTLYVDQYYAYSTTFIDNPLWWGACNLSIYGNQSFPNSITSEDGYIMTSLGMTWPEVYANYWQLKQLSSILKVLDCALPTNVSDGLSWWERCFLKFAKEKNPEALNKLEVNYQKIKRVINSSEVWQQYKVYNNTPVYYTGITNCSSDSDCVSGSSWCTATPSSDCSSSSCGSLCELNSGLQMGYFIGCGDGNCNSYECNSGQCTCTDCIM